ncbi:putative Ulp1 protease family catalytic domain-containing protein [Rosa chinensis]|uniref:Putative Ulp1 protease family catalytic domain-containing protein n=1 Tax=Rosa chinensis TaxID=74649 RepID=A0A2P6SKE6_ROSCH|nr:putative Ulp1 protease family catalytic domain-containing protein [Rosa chinensis]
MLIQGRAIEAAKKGGDDWLEFVATAPKRFAAILQYRKGLKNGEKIFIPMLDPDTTPRHWFFIVIKIATTDVEIWDTCPSPARKMARNDLVYYVLLALDTIFDTEIQSCFKKGWSFCSFTVRNVDDIEFQQNDFDCGIFMLRYIINYDNPLKDELDSVNRRVQLALWMLKHPKNQAWLKINEALDNENKNDGAQKKIKTIEDIDEAIGNSVDDNYEKRCSKVVQKKSSTVQARGHEKRCSKVLQKKSSTVQARGRGRPLGAKNRNSRK